MRETRNAQASIFEEYSNHEYGVRLRKLSEILDRQPKILDLVAADLIDTSVAAVGRTGLSAESVLRCLLLKQQRGFSYQVGDHVIPLYTPECGECKFCTSGKTNSALHGLLDLLGITENL